MLPRLCSEVLRRFPVYGNAKCSNVFLFLPGWAPVILLVVSLALFLAGKRLFPKDYVPAKSRFLSSPAYDALLCLCAFFSALVTACAALGWIG